MTENQVDELRVFCQLVIDKKGKVKEFGGVAINPVIDDEVLIENLRNDIIEMMEHYPKITPARFFNQRVNYVLVVDLKL